MTSSRAYFLLAAGGYPTGYLYGLEFSYVSGTEVQITPTGTMGVAKADDDGSVLALSAPVTLDIDASGAGGLDTGAPVNDTWYAAWLIGGKNVPTSAVLVAGTAQPTLPAGYTSQRYIGAAYRLSTGSFRPFVCHGKGIRRTYEYNDSDGSDLQIYAGGGVVGSWQTMSAAAFIPRTATRIQLNVYTVNITAAAVSTPGTSVTHSDAPNFVHLGPIFATTDANGNIRRREATSGNSVFYHAYGWEEDI